MPNTLISVDLRRPPEEQTPPPHNRWHPDLPPVVSVDPGTVFRVECLDLTGGQVLNSDSADDVRELDLRQLHYLAGPVGVNGARPGDLLVVDILDVGPLAGAEWGYTVILDREMGTGLLREEFPEARKAIWDLNGIYATSRHVEGVRFVGLPHPGVLGCAPSAGMLARWQSREREVLAAHAGPFTRAALFPQAEGALPGRFTGAEAARVAREGARTWPARENGGNMNVKELTPGSRVYLPVYVPGAHLAVGDLQFSQGDGKVTGFGGIKMAGWIDLHVDLIPDGMRRQGITSPVFEPAVVERGYAQCLTFQGISVDEEGAQHYLDVRVAYREACRSAIRYLERFGYSGEQAYVLLGSAPVHGRLSCMHQDPNVTCTLSLPAGIFDFPLDPRHEPVPAEPRGELARPS